MTDDMPGRAARYEGRLSPLAALLLRNLLFSILTLGIYRFWGRTHVRRFVWRHTVLLDDALEYLGTGGELFIGFLIAVALLLPVFAAYSALQFLFADGPGHALLALEILYYLALFFLVQVAIHRMRRYRLTRTAWRGVRFGLGGSSLAYARIAFGYGLLTAATAGLAYPWMRVATLGYFARHAYFGTVGAALAPDARWLFRHWAAVIAWLLGVIGLFAVLNLENFATMLHYEEHASHNMRYAASSMIYWPLFLLPVSFLLWIRYRVVEFRHFTNALTIGNTGFNSHVRVKNVFSQSAIYISILVAAWVFVLGFSVSMMIGIVTLDTGLSFTLIPVLLAVGLLLFSGIIKTLFLDIPLLAHACQTLGITNAAALEAVAQSSASVPGYGEGAAEALDVGGF